MQSFRIEVATRTDDGLGAITVTWGLFKTVEGYIDLLTGTDLNALQNSYMEQSTHVLIIPSFTEGITDEMRVVDGVGRMYTITYADDPVGQGHHNELYLTFGGVADG